MSKEKSDMENGWGLPDGMNPMKVMQVASAYWNSCVLHTANRLDIFNLLEAHSKDLDTLVRETGSDHRCLAALLSALVSMEFLDRDGDVFRNNQFGQIFLIESSQYYQGGIVFMFENWYKAWGGLYETVKTGNASALMHQSYSDEETRNYMMGMHNRALSQADVLTSMFDLNGKKQLMDVGCGPSTFAVKFCEKFNGLNAIAMDREQNLKIAREIVDEYGMQERVELRIGDYNTDSLGEGNDAILLSSMTNQESTENIKRLLQKCYDSMSQGGVIMIQEQLLSADKKGPELAALIGVNQIINTLAGSSYSSAEMEQFLHGAGFVDIESRKMADPSPFVMVSGYRR